ncbi:MAG TPA: GGDEF domain-containing protein [Acidiferrobacterales bacterium]
MAGKASAASQKAVIEGIKRLLDGLRQTADGVVLYSLIERALKKYIGADGKLEHAFLAFLYKLLANYLANPEIDGATRVKARLLQQRLLPFLPAGTPTPVVSPRVLAAAQARPRPATPASTPAAPSAPPRRARPAAPAAEAGRGKAARAAAPPRRPEIVADRPPPAVPRGDADNDELDILQIRLARNVAEAIARNREFDALLKSSLMTLQQSGGDVDDLRGALVDGIEKLIDGHQTLGDRLHDTTSYLKVMHSDRRQLRDALHKARKYSLTDELTGLPNRAAFLRHLDGEIGRARRYGFSLAVAIIDVDDLKTVNDRHGYDAGDAVLHCYTREVLSQFRAYDVVARYGGDEFAVLFPNTQKEGANRALEKAQKRAAETVLSFQGQSLPLPTFSSVLTLYSPGEKSATLLKRADEALDHAKLRGRNQSIVALPAG